MNTANPNHLAYIGRVPGAGTSSRYTLPPEWRARIPEGCGFINLLDLTQQEHKAFTAPDSVPSVVLMNNTTETALFQRLVASCDLLCLTQGRIRFLDENGKRGGASNTRGQALFLFCGGEAAIKARFRKAMAGHHLLDPEA